MTTVAVIGSVFGGRSFYDLFARRCLNRPAGAGARFSFFGHSLQAMVQQPNVEQLCSRTLRALNWRQNVKEREHFGPWLASVVERSRAFRKTSERHYDFAEVNGWRAGAEHLLAELVGIENPYYKRFVATSAQDTNGYAPTVESNFAIMRAVEDDFNNARLRSFRSIVEADVFADLIEMAEHILQNGYYGAAAALTGGVLERGLRDIAAARNVPTGALGDLPGLNARLAQAGVYNTLRQKEVQYYIDVRNKAAHGEFDKFNLEDARKMVGGVRDLLAAYGTS